MTEKGKVVKVKDGVATVIFQRCADCDRCNVCRPRKDGRTVECSVQNSLDVSEGDVVKVETKGRKFVVVMTLCYLFPVLLTAVCIGVGLMFGKTTAIVLACFAAFVGYAVAIPVSIYLNKRYKLRAPKMQSIPFESTGEEVK